MKNGEGFYEKVLFKIFTVKWCIKWIAIKDTVHGTDVQWQVINIKIKYLNEFQRQWVALGLCVLRTYSIEIGPFYDNDIK